MRQGFSAVVCAGVRRLAAAASADETGAEFKLRPDDTFVSPDHPLRIEAVKTPADRQ